MLTVIKLFSILVASGKAHRCTELRSILRDKLLETDEATGQLKVITHKYGKKTHPKEYAKICEEVAEGLEELYVDVEKKYFGTDRNKNRSPSN